MRKLLPILYVLTGMTSAPLVHASDTVTSNTNQIVTSTSINNVLNELSQRQSLTPALFKPSNEPSLLASNSALMNVSSLKIPVNEQDTLSHLTLVASNAVKLFKQSGRASWYGGKFHGRKTASGERFNMNSMTAAHPSLPFNTYLKVTNKSNGKSVIVKVNDRGPFSGNRILDLSYGAAKKIGLVNAGVGNVSIEKVTKP